MVAAKRLPQNGGEVSHRLSAHQDKRYEILVAQLGDLPHLDLLLLGHTISSV